MVYIVKTGDCKHGTCKEKLHNKKRGEPLKIIKNKNILYSITFYKYNHIEEQDNVPTGVCIYLMQSLEFSI